MFQLWVELIKEEKEGAAMEAKMNAKAAQMGRFNDKNKKSAGTASERAALLLDVSLQSWCFCQWKREWKVEFMRRYGKAKNDKRKQELVGVKGLFKDFANKLETSL